MRMVRRINYYYRSTYCHLRFLGVLINNLFQIPFYLMIIASAYGPLRTARYLDKQLLRVPIIYYIYNVLKTPLHMYTTQPYCLFCYTLCIDMFDTPCLFKYRFIITILSFSFLYLMTYEQFRL